MLWQDFLELLAPSPFVCDLCQQQIIDEGLPGCRSCLAQLELRLRVLQVSGIPCYAVGVYQNRMKELLREIKYQGNYKAAFVLGMILGLACQEEAALQGVRWILPVPLHANRIRKRGFNQARVLADGMIRVWKRPIYQGMIRIRDTEPQSDLSPVERRKNLQQAFMITDAKVLLGQQVLIVDDIFTTGTTVQTIASLIAGYGAVPRGLFVAKSLSLKGLGGNVNAT